MHELRNIGVVMVCFHVLIVFMQQLPPFYCWETSMPTVAYGVAPKLMFVESWSVISLNITCLC